MGENQHIKKLFQKFIDNTISQEGFDELFNAINSADVDEDVKMLMEQHWENINTSGNADISEASDNDDLLHSIVEKINKKKPIKKLNSRKAMSTWYRIAAIFVIAFGAAYFFYFNSLGNINEPLTGGSEEQITLQLDNGEVKVISEEEEEQIVNARGLVLGRQSGNSIVYENNISEQKLVYNTLTVPYGKRFQIVLSDGTKVHLNAGTSLKYPVKFIAGTNREVFLNGEAFFDVVKDQKHPFLVNSNNLHVQVLGTKFNVTSYAEDDVINTVLVEGSVKVFDKENRDKSNKQSILKPGFKAVWNKHNRNININKVNIEEYVAWMDGKLILDEITFEDIQKKLERQYNVSFINNIESLKQRKFTARFDIENIDQVMKSLSISASFDYTLTNNNEIIINFLN